MTDAEIESLYRRRGSLPTEQRAAVERAYADMAARKWPSASAWGSAPDDPVFWSPPQDDGLGSSATSIAVEPVVGARPTQEQLDDALAFPGQHPAASVMAGRGGGLGIRNTPEDLAAYGEVVRDAYGRTIDRGVARRQAARAAGYQDPEQVAYNDVTGVPAGAAGDPDTVMVDGVEVPAYRLSDGKPFGGMFREGDLRAAQAAAAEAARLGRFRANQDADRAKYGDISGRTPQQRQAYDARNQAERAEQFTPRAEAMRLERLSGRAGVTMAEAADKSPEELLALAADQRNAQKNYARGVLARRAQLSRNPMEYLGREDITEAQRDVVSRNLSGRAGLAGGLQDLKAREVDARIEAMRAEQEAARDGRAQQDRQFTERMQQERQQFDARMAAESAARQQQHEQVLARMTQEAAEAEARFGLGSKEAEARMAALMAQIEQARLDSETRRSQHAESIGLRREELGLAQQQAANNLERLEREQLLGSLSSQYGDGIRSLAEGDYGTPASQEALRGIAADSDQSFYGFWRDDAARMDAVLRRLGISDPAARQQLVETYGMEPSEDFLGSGGRGRGERGSYWFSGRPW